MIAAVYFLEKERMYAEKLEVLQTENADRNFIKDYKNIVYDMYCIDSIPLGCC